MTPERGDGRAPTTRLGLTIGLEGADLRDAVELCRAAEDAGYTDVWSAEVGGADGFSPLAALAQVSRTVRLGSAIVPAFSRPPALLAMSAASLQQLSGGRFVLGVGTSSSIIVERWMGERFDEPLTKLRETVEVVRAALTGEKVDFSGRTTNVSDYRLQLALETPPPIYVAALGPAACRLAGAVADGVIFFLKTSEGVAEALRWVAQGAEQAERDPSFLDVVMRIPAAVDPDPEVYPQLARRQITAYAIVDVYNRSLAGQGFSNEVDEIASAFWSGDRAGAAAAVTEDMMDRLFVAGDAEDCRSRLEDFRSAGVKTPVLLPIVTSKEPDARREEYVTTMRQLAPTAPDAARSARASP